MHHAITNKPVVSTRIWVEGVWTNSSIGSVESIGDDTGYLEVVK